jgi:hypothetical protein
MVMMQSRVWKQLHYFHKRLASVDDKNAEPFIKECRNLVMGATRNLRRIERLLGRALWNQLLARIGDPLDPYIALTDACECGHTAAKHHEDGMVEGLNWCNHCDPDPLRRCPCQDFKLVPKEKP